MGTWPDAFTNSALLECYKDRTSGIQKRITTVMDAATDKELGSELEAVGEPHTIRQALVRNHGTSYFLTTLPTETAYIIPSNAFSNAVSFRQGQHDNNLSPICGACRKDMTNNGDHHFAGCNGLKRRAITTRHDMIKQHIASVFRSAGAQVRVEPVTNEGKRPDIAIYTPRGCVLLDVAVVHPLAPSNIKAARGAINKRDLSHVAGRERQKVQKYGPIAKREKSVFVPVVMDSYGNHGSGLAECIKLIKDLAKDKVGLRAGELIYQLKAGINIQLYSGNGLSILQGSMETYAHSHGNMGKVATSGDATLNREVELKEQPTQQPVVQDQPRSLRDKIRHATITVDSAAIRPALRHGPPAMAIEVELPSDGEQKRAVSSSEIISADVEGAIAAAICLSDTDIIATVEGTSAARGRLRDCREQGQPCNRREDSPARPTRKRRRTETDPDQEVVEIISLIGSQLASED
jgi:hypothetical protein